MIQLSKNYSLPDRLAEFIPVKIVSVCGAGLNALDRIVLDGLERAGVVAINTDVQSLTSSVAPHKVQLGRTVTAAWARAVIPSWVIKPLWNRLKKFAKRCRGGRGCFFFFACGGGRGRRGGPPRATTRA